MIKKNIYVILANGISDIGKGWLTAAIGVLLDPTKTLPIKIDPLLNIEFPKNLGVEIGQLCDSNVIKKANFSKDYKISDDFLTYKEAQMDIYPQCNFIAGQIISDFLNYPVCEIRPREIKKRTFNDLSFFIAEKIVLTVENIEKIFNKLYRNIVIEVGGTIEDQENIYLPATLRFLHNSFVNSQHKYFVKLCLLTFLEQTEIKDEHIYKLKTQYVRNGIRILQKKFYGLPIEGIFIRRRYVSDNIADQIILDDFKNIAYETQFDYRKLVLIPNVKNVFELALILSESGLIKNE